MWVDVHLPVHVGIHLCFFYSHVFEHSIPKVCVDSFIQVVFTILMWLNLTPESLLILFKPTFLSCGHFNLFSLMCSLSVFGLIVVFCDSLKLALLSSLQISHVDIPMSSDTALFFVLPFRNCFRMSSCVTLTYLALNRTADKRHKWREDKVDTFWPASL